MRRLSLSRPGAGGLPLALAAGLALTASACMAPSAKQSSAAGPAGQQAAKAQDGEKEKGESQSWWQRMTRSGQEAKEKPWVYGDVRPGKGLLGTDKDGYVLLRKGEGQSPARSGKPEKVRR